MSDALNNLPPELQARIAQIVSGAALDNSPTEPETPHQAAIANRQPAPSLMDHTIALRQEVAQMSAQVQAIGQVTEAVGQAVGELYQLFRAQTATTDYSSAYQAQQDVDSDY